MTRSARIARLAAAALLLIATVAPAQAQAPEATPAVRPASPAGADSLAVGDGFQVQRQANGRRQVRARLRDLRIADAVRLAGVQGEIGVPFGARADEVLSAASLTLDFAYSPALLPDLSSLTVIINGEVVRSVPLPRQTADGLRLDIPIEPALVTPGDNRLNLRLIGHYTRDCEDPLHNSLWANISNSRTYLDLTFQKLAAVPDLSRFPAPFFDAHDDTPLRLPFVFAGAPGDGELQAAAAMAGAFGGWASYRGFSFPVGLNALPELGDGVVFMTPDRMVAGLERPITGPSASVVVNPNDPFGLLLLVMGTNAAELRRAAAALAYGEGVMEGAQADFSSFEPPVLGAYEAPRWLGANRVVPLGELTDPRELVGQGLPPGRLSSSFRLAPDLFFWPREGGRLNARYRYPRGEWLDADRSRLDLSLNGQYLRTLPLAKRGWFDRVTQGAGSGSAESRATAVLPSYALFGQNRLDFFYDLQPADTGACTGRLPNEVQASILPTSTVDFRGGRNAALLPDLSLFAGGGFPFTRTPDLGETAVIMPANAGAAETEAFLNLMGQFGDATGAPATRVTVARTAQPDRLAGKDVLVIGAAAAAAAPELFEKAPARWRQGRFETARASPLSRTMSRLSPIRRDDPSVAEAALAAAGGAEGLAAFRSPYDRDRSVVAVFAGQPTRLPALTTLLATDRAKSQAAGDLVLRVGPNLRAFQIGPSYWTGDLPPWLHVAYWFAQRPLALAAATLLAAFMIAVPLHLLLKRRANRRLGQMAGKAK